MYYPYSLPNKPAIPVAVLNAVPKGLLPPMGAGGGDANQANCPRPPPSC